jgi:hypothetical protein
VRKRRDILATYEFTRADSDNDTIFTETWEKLYANFFHDAWHDPAVARTAAYWRTILRGFCTIALADMETEIAAANGVLRRSIFHYFWTKLRETSSRYLPQHLLPQGGVPPMGQLQLAITAFGQDPGSEALVYQSTFKSLLLAFGEHYWNPDIVPDYLYEPDVLEDKDDASERLPVMELFHAMLIYVVAFFPYVSQHLASRLGLLNHSLREAHDVIRAIAANDPTHGMREARDLIAQLYIPERQYEMQAMLTGRVVFNGMFLSALHDAYRTLQRMATRHTPQPGLWKRSRFEGDNDVYSYAAYADVPMDILTCNTDPNPGPAGGGPTRPYIDTQRTSASVIMQLRTAMAQLVAQHIFKIRFNAPDAYKTTAQYARAPIELQTAQHAMLPFSFTDLGNHAWAVTLT